MRHTRALDLRMSVTTEHWTKGCASHQSTGLKDVRHTRALDLRMCVTPEYSGVTHILEEDEEDVRHTRALDKWMGVTPEH